MLLNHLQTKMSGPLHSQSRSLKDGQWWFYVGTGCCSTPDFGWLGIPSSAWTKFFMTIMYCHHHHHHVITSVLSCGNPLVDSDNLPLKLKTSHLFSPLFFRLVKCLPVGDRKASLVASSLQLPQGLGIMATRFLTPKPPLRMAVIGTIKL